jgi:glutathione S-transferase
MITLHHLNNSRSQRVLWMLEELELPYKVAQYQRDKITMRAPASLKKVHPLGRSPIITDGKNTIAESGAIIEYLLSKKPESRLKPAIGTAAQLKFTYWLHYAEGSAMPPLLLNLIFSKIPEAPMPALARAIVRPIAEGIRTRFVKPELKLHLDYIEESLSASPWFAGRSFTAADIQMSFAVEAARSAMDAAKKGTFVKQYPHMNDFLTRIHARAAYKKALEVGGKYDL